MKKFLNRQQILKVRRELRKSGKTVVFTNGCFDLLHAGHIRLFREAKKQGNVLVVALNDDASVKKIKGPSRPIFPLAERAEVLAAIAAIDYLTSFSEKTPRRIIASLLPDILVKGGDWKPEEVVGKKEVEAAGGRVVIVPYVQAHSSSALIQKIIRHFESSQKK